jgi:hypothetical protein
LLRLSLLTLVIIIPALLIGARFGIIGVAVGHLVAVLIRRIISLALATRFVNVTLKDILGELGLPYSGNGDGPVVRRFPTDLHLTLPAIDLDRARRSSQLSIGQMER